MKNEKLCSVLDYTIEVVGDFIGYESSATIDNAIACCLSLVSSTLELTTDQHNECLATLKDLFLINKYFDYVLRKEKNDIYNSDYYESVLKKLNNKTKKFNSIQFKEHLNTLSIQGEQRAIRLKAFLFESGIIYKQNRPLSIALFKKCGYSFDTKALLILSKIDAKQSERYLSLYDAVMTSFDSDGFIKNKDYIIESIVGFYKKACSKNVIDFELVEELINDESHNRKVGFVL